MTLYLYIPLILKYFLDNLRQNKNPSENELLTRWMLKQIGAGKGLIKNLVMVRGAGDLATGTIYRLARCGFKVIALEIDSPTVIRRTVAFAQAVFDGTAVVEGLKAIKTENYEDALAISQGPDIPVLIDPTGASIEQLQPEIVIDAIIAKHNLGTYKIMAPIVIALGPGFNAGRDVHADVHAVIETCRGHNLGRCIYEGNAQSDTGNPGVIEGYGKERIIRAPSAGQVCTVARIGDRVKKGDIVAYTAGSPAVSALDGILRGLIQSGLTVEQHCKIGDVDPRDKPEYCYSISDKSRAVSGGVLEAILYLRKFCGL
jgi:selenium-dependent molybdenum hydroxylase system protein, YqeB family